MDGSDILATSRYSKSLATLTMEEKATLVQTVTLHFVLLKSKAEADQFLEGLKAIGVADALKKHPGLLEPFFTKSGIPTLTAGVLQIVFHGDMLM